MELKLINEQGKAASTLQASDALFGRDYNEALVPQIVVAYQANARSGNRAQKDRGEVSHTTKKPWRQKGTGRARAGTNRSPLWRHGGVTFGPNGRNYKIDLPKKVRRLALCSALSMKLKENKMLIVDKLELPEIKTRGVVAILKQLGLSSVLIVEQENLNLEKSARNVPLVKVLRPEGLNVYDILKYKNLVLLETAIKTIEGRLAA